MNDELKKEFMEWLIDFIYGTTKNIPAYEELEYAWKHIQENFVSRERVVADLEDTFKDNLKYRYSAGSLDDFWVTTLEEILQQLKSKYIKEDK